MSPRPVSITARQSASPVSVSGRSLVMPAQITIARTGPSSSSARRTHLVTSVALVRSARAATARTPISEAAFSSSLAGRSSRR
jgi:hypothetical protein